MKHAMLALVATGCLLAAPLASARPGPPGEDRGPGGDHAMIGGWHGGSGFEHGYMGFLAGVQLSDSQRQQLRQIVAAARTREHDTMEQLRALDRQIADQLDAAGTLDPASVTALQQQAAQLRDTLDAARLSVAIEVRGLLTSEQLSKAATTHAQLKALHDQERALLEANRPSPN